MMILSTSIFSKLSSFVHTKKTTLASLPRRYFSHAHMAAATPDPVKKRKVPVAGLEARVELIDGMFPLPKDAEGKPPTLDMMSKIRGHISVAAKAIYADLQANPDVKYDMGRMIHAMDLLQQAKDTACVAVLLPHAVKEVPDDS